MPFRRNALSYQVDEQFFEKWNRKVAYILGFTFADGNIYKTSISWDLQTRDIEILRKFNKTLGSSYPITFYRNKSCRLRISNQMLVSGAIKRGLLPKKNIRNILPTMPKYLLRHFIRGYLDGDGWITIRKRRNEINIGFSSGNRPFLVELNKIITRQLRLSSREVRTRIKVTPNNIRSTTYMLEFYCTKAMGIISWLYGNLKSEDLYLQRKYKVYLEAKELDIYLKSGTRGTRRIQKQFGRSMKSILSKLYLRQNLDGVKIAEVLGVHPSSVYRWLAQTGIKYPVPRES